MKNYEPCDIRGDEGLRTRKENISTCVTSHIAQNGGMNHAGLVKEYEVCDFRYDEGFRTRVENQIMPTLATKSGGGMSQLPYAIERVKMEERKDIKHADKYCQYCGKKLERKRFNGRLEDYGVFLKRQYCNRECMRKGFLKIGESDANWSNAHSTARNINKLILKKDYCEICGSTENLDMHHIDGNWKNNNLDNLMCLCRSCHMKIERNDVEIEKGGDNANVRIRKLTPKECWRIRLMGFDDESFNRAKAVNSDTQLYKQAGNSIVVQVLEDIFKEML